MDGTRGRPLGAPQFQFFLGVAVSLTPFRLNEKGEGFLPKKLKQRSPDGAAVAAIIQFSVAFTMSAAAPPKVEPNRLVSFDETSASIKPAIIGYAADMKPILTDFDLDWEQAKKVLSLTGAMIAGSAVTSALTKTFRPNDIDIWVRLEGDLRSYTMKDGVEIHDVERYDLDKATNRLRIHTIETLLTENGYSIERSARSFHYYGGMATPIIHEIRNFCKDGKRVQLISTKYPLSKVLDDFDLDICCCWWQGGNIFCRYPIAFLRLEVSLCGSHKYDLEDSADKRTKAHRFERIQKYLERGIHLSPSLEHDVSAYLRMRKLRGLAPAPAPAPAAAGGAGAGAGAAAAAGVKPRLVKKQMPDADTKSLPDVVMEAETENTTAVHPCVCGFG